MAQAGFPVCGDVPQGLPVHGYPQNERVVLAAPVTGNSIFIIASASSAEDRHTATIVFGIPMTDAPVATLTRKVLKLSLFMAVLRGISG